MNSNRLRVNYSFCSVFTHFQTALEEEKDNSDDADDDSDDSGGPKVIILEQERPSMETICRLGACYFGVIPPSPLLHFDDSYDSIGLDVSARPSYISVQKEF